MILALLVSLALPVQAQNQPQADPFCPMAPADLLVALDGTWSLVQGAGAAWAISPGVGGMGIPFPAERTPVALTFRYEADVGVTVVTGSNMDEQIIMRPLETETASIDAPAWAFAESLLTNGLSDSDTSAGSCDWYTLPILFGTNRYTFTEYRRWMSLVTMGEDIFGYGDYDDIICDLWGIELVRNTMGPQRELDNKCGNRVAGNISGFMQMTVVLRFQRRQQRYRQSIL